MEDEIDPFDFVLAERLHMTIAGLGDMTNAEYLAWRAFTNYRTAMAELEAKEPQ
jgi:hypothetical protein